MTAVGGAKTSKDSGARGDLSGPDWARMYATRLVVTDFIVIAWAVIGTQIAWFGTLDAELNLSEYRGGFALNYSLVSIILIAAWTVFLAIFGTRDARVIGTGTNEYKRVVDATVRLFGIVAIFAFLFQLSLARGYIIVALPVGTLALLASRWIWRQWLSAQRARGQYSSRVLLVGSRISVTSIARELSRAPQAG